MRRLTLVALLVLTACTDTEEPLPLGGAFLITPTAIDFGTVDVGLTVERTVAVENRTEEALNLTVRRAADTSNVFASNETSLSVPAAGIGTFEISFAPSNTDTYAGQIEVTDGTIVRAIDVRGNVPTESCITVGPASIDFGNVVRDSTETREVEIRNLCSDDAHVRVSDGVNADLCGESIQNPDFCVSLTDREVDEDGSFQLDAGERVTVSMNFKPRTASARSTGSIVFSTCSSERCRHEVLFEGVGLDNGFVCAPTTLDFGLVNPGSCVTETLTCENIANAQITVVGWGPVVSGGVPTSEDYEIEPSSVHVLNQGDSIEIDVTYCPSALGEDTGTLGIETDNRDARLRNVFVPLRGTGGGPDVDVSPSDCLDFGLVSTLAPARRSVLITNVGFSPLEIIDIIGDTQQTGAFRAPGARGGILQPGDAMTVVVEFLPLVAGPVESGLLIRSNDLDEPETTICLKGEGITLPVCNFTVPTTLDFGDVPVGHIRHRDFAIENTGPGDCLITSLQLVPGTDPAFATRNVMSTILAVGERFPVEIVYAPRSAGTQTGMAEFSISSQMSPFNTVGLSGTATDDTPLVVPTVADFGSVGPTCQPFAKSIRFHNRGSTAATVNTIDFAGAGFTFETVPSLPADVAPGASIEVDVVFDPSTAGSFAAAVRFSGARNGNSFAIYGALRGVSQIGAAQTDEFAIIPAPKADVLFVLDNSCSTGQEQAGIANNFGNFTRFAQTNAIDYQIGVTTTSLRQGLGEGRLVHASQGPNGEVDLFGGPVANKIVTPQSLPNPAAVFQLNASVGQGGPGSAIDESGFDAMLAALTAPNIFGHNAGFERSDASLAVIFMSDEWEQSRFSVDFYAALLESLKGTPNRHLVSASSIVGDVPSGCNGPGGSAPGAPRYVELANRTNGLFQSVCTSDWSRTMSDLGDRAFGYRSRYPLRAPAVRTTIEVEVDGVRLPSTSSGGTVNWTYDGADNAVAFNPFATPAPGSSLRITYDVACR